jgi:hypothetical protein
MVSADFSESSTLCVSSNAGLTWFQPEQGEGLKFTALAVTEPTAPAGPTLNIANSGNNDSLSWIDSVTGYALQSTPSLSPVDWQNVPQTPATNNGNLVTTVPMSGSQGYYRLFLTNSPPAGLPTIYLGTDSAGDQGVLQSLDGGITWNSTGLTGDTINAVAVSPINANLVYAGLAGKQDSFLSTVLTNGQLYFSTFLGGSGADQGTAVAVDLQTAFLVGSTWSSDFPTAGPPQSSLHANSTGESGRGRRGSHSSIERGGGGPPPPLLGH